MLESKVCVDSQHVHMCVGTDTMAATMMFRPNLIDNISFLLLLAPGRFLLLLQFLPPAVFVVIDLFGNMFLFMGP